MAAKLASDATTQWRSRSLTDQHQTTIILRIVDKYPSNKAFQNLGVIAMAILYKEIIVEISTLEELGLKRTSFQDHHSKDNARIAMVLRPKEDIYEPRSVPAF